MTSRKLLIALGIACCVGLPARSHAQNRFLFNFKGVAWTTNSTGRFVSSAVNNKTLIRDYITLNNLPKKSKLELAYHVGGDDRGDQVEVVDTKTKTVVGPLFSFYFGTAFGRPDLVTSDGSDIKRLDYIYTHQIDHSAGSALNNIHYSVDASGQTNHVVVSGQMDYMLQPDASHKTTQIVNGNYTIGKAVVTN